MVKHYRLVNTEGGKKVVTGGYGYKQPEIAKQSVSRTYRKRRYKFKGKIGRAVNRLLRGIETKYHTYALSHALTETMDAFYLTVIAEGDTQSTRTGLEIFAKKIHIKGTLVGDEYATNNIRTFVRVMLIQDTEVFRAFANTDIFENTTTAMNMVTSHHKWANGGRFKYLYDKVFNLQEMGSGNSQRTFEIVRNLNCKITYNGPDGDDTARGHLYLVCIACAGSPNSSITASHEPQIEGYSRLYFTDS